MRNTILAVVGILIVIGIVGAIWLNAKNNNQSNQTTSVPSTQAVNTPSPMATEEASPSASGASGSATQAGTITVEGNEFKFTPATLTVKKGQQVKVTFKNTGQYPHNFIVDELNVKSNTIQPGQSDTVTFTPSKTGAFTYYCGVDAHEQKGMKGTITVQ